MTGRKLTSIVYVPGVAAVGAGEPDSLSLDRSFPAAASGIDGVSGAMSNLKESQAVKARGRLANEARNCGLSLFEGTIFVNVDKG